MSCEVDISFYKDTCTDKEILADIKSNYKNIDKVPLKRTTLEMAKVAIDQNVDALFYIMSTHPEIQEIIDYAFTKDPVKVFDTILPEFRTQERWAKAVKADSSELRLGISIKDMKEISMLVWNAFLVSNSNEVAVRALLRTLTRRERDVKIEPLYFMTLKFFYKSEFKEYYPESYINKIPDKVLAPFATAVFKGKFNEEKSLEKKARALMKLYEE